MKQKKTVRIIPLEHNPCDSRIKYIDGDICQSLTARMGTGGNNVPLILEIVMDQDYEDVCEKETL